MLASLPPGISLRASVVASMLLPPPNASLNLSPLRECTLGRFVLGPPSTTNCARSPGLSMLVSPGYAVGSERLRTCWHPSCKRKEKSTTDANVRSGLAGQTAHGWSLGRLARSSPDWLRPDGLGALGSPVLAQSRSCRPASRGASLHRPEPAWSVTPRCTAWELADQMVSGRRRSRTKEQWPAKRWPPDRLGRSVGQESARAAPFSRLALGSPERPPPTPHPLHLPPLRRAPGPPSELRCPVLTPDHRLGTLPACYLPPERGDRCSWEPQPA